MRLIDWKGNRVTTFGIADTNFYVPVVTLSTQDNIKLLQQVKSGFKHKINLDKYQSLVSGVIGGSNGETNFPHKLLLPDP